MPSCVSLVSSKSLIGAFSVARRCLHIGAQRTFLFLVSHSRFRVFHVGTSSPLYTRSHFSLASALVVWCTPQFSCQNIRLLGLCTPFFWLCSFPGHSGAGRRCWLEFPKLESSSWKDWCAYGEILEFHPGGDWGCHLCHLAGGKLRPESVWETGADLCLRWLADPQSHWQSKMESMDGPSQEDG